ncbi:uncharacterized protein LY89DRAFT_687106 [Mollisia scopiformis]|uniref:Uncharacterized protein n=1 Tax=Mollisia scopiformis TaxID=149040 RepID=A0A194X1K1_MOLSC|nr:uncharacterized protein LY89DRAFT_687106 [Mollisia scopiformis]KUJ13722.1 hypothetical protein LY89DRAFT_687106 [Mollisia scopiformis]
MWAGEGWLCCGSENNKSFSSIQINFTPINLTSIESLKGRGEIHDDRSDDRACPSVMFALHNVPSGWFPGRFSLTNFRLTMTAEPFTAIAFSGVFPHTGSGLGPYPAGIPEDSPFRCQPFPGITYPALPEGAGDFRLAAVVYPGSAMHRVRDGMTARSVTRTLNGHGSLLNHLQWQMLSAIRAERKLMEERIGITEAYEYMSKTGNPAQWVSKYSMIDDTTGLMVAPSIQAVVMRWTSVQRTGKRGRTFTRLPCIIRQSLLHMENQETLMVCHRRGGLLRRNARMLHFVV